MKRKIRSQDIASGTLRVSKEVPAVSTDPIAI
jgi:hypothetical protein